MMRRLGRKRLIRDAKMALPADEGRCTILARVKTARRIVQRLPGRARRGLARLRDGVLGAANDARWSLHIPQDGRLVVCRPPQLSLMSRDPAAVLDVSDERVGRARIDRAAALAAVAGASPELAEAVVALPWYHTLELAPGVTTCGVYDHRPLVPHYGLPADLAGVRALDVGTADGFWAFELERRGADVVAVDLEATSASGLPASAVPALGGRLLPGRMPQFALARETLASRVRIETCDVYALDPDRLGTFSFVHAGDLLLHVERPWEALRAMRSVTEPGGRLHLADVVDPALRGRDGETFLVRYLGGWRTVHWWTPSVDALAQMAVDAGFTDLHAHCVYNLPQRGQPSGPWRVVLQARAV